MLEHMSKEMWESLPGNQSKNKSPERSIKNAIGDWLDAHRVPWNRMNSGKVQVINPRTRKPYWIKLCRKGTEDISAIWKDGRYLAIETKARGGKLSIDQVLRKKEVIEAGGIYIVAFSVDDLERELKP